MKIKPAVKKHNNTYYIQSIISKEQAHKINNLDEDKYSFELSWSDNREKTYQQLKFFHKALKNFILDKNINFGVEEVKQSFYESYIVDMGLISFRLKTAKLYEVNIFIDWFITELADRYGYMVQVEDTFSNSQQYVMIKHGICNACGGDVKGKIIHKRTSVLCLCEKHKKELEEDDKFLERYHLRWQKMEIKENNVISNN